MKVSEDTLLLGWGDHLTPTLSLRASRPGGLSAPGFLQHFCWGLGPLSPKDHPPSGGKADLVPRLSALPAQKVKPQLPGAWAKVRVPSPDPSVQGALFPECVPKQDVSPGHPRGSRPLPCRLQLTQCRVRMWPRAPCWQDLNPSLNRQGAHLSTQDPQGHQLDI